MKMCNLRKLLCFTISISFFTFVAVSGLKAKDTDIYELNVKQNCYILLDNSGSMGFGVYEHNIDYGAMFDYLFTLNDSPVGDYGDYIYDTVNNSDYFYLNHHPKEKIYLWLGAIGVTVTTVDGVDIAFTGDAADPNYLWYSNQMVDTHTLIDSNGNLSDDGTGLRRITVDTDGYILLDGTRLPLSMDVKLHDFQTLYDGSQIDNGFGGLINAPGYMFSGYEGVTAGSLDVAEGGDTNIYFFVTGNWANMQAMYNLHYTTNNPDPAGAFTGDMAWEFETFPISQGSWSPINYTAQYPASGVYSNDENYGDLGSVNTIVHNGAEQIQVHFSSIDIESNGASSCYDYVGLFDQTDTLIAQYCTNTLPSDGWSAPITGDTVHLKFDSDYSIVGTGYVVDQIRVTYVMDAYLMQNRLDVAKDALLYVLDEFHGKMNWGFATYNKDNGATVHSALNPNLTDDVNRAAIVNHVENEEPGPNATPLGEALQDVWAEGYYTKRHALDNLNCRKNYIISVTDGFPSEDTDWSRIPGVTFSDWDGDAWTSDPYQPPTSPNYYDDVSNWIYTHNWQSDTMDVVTDPEDSYVNVVTHHIAFGAKHPLLADAADESGGNYITAYNKTQLVAAFYALAMQMSEAVSFTAPVVSVDAKNKIQSGDDLFLGLFLPKDATSWVGNIKKYKLGDGSADRPDLWSIYDGANDVATDATGAFKDNTAAFWADDNDPNDYDNYGAADVAEDGVGEVLKERVVQNLVDGATTATEYYDRPIYTYLNGSMTKFDKANIAFTDLAVGDDATRNALINYVYGYTNEQDVTTGAPLTVRDWVLGAIVHSRLIVIDYYDPANLSVLLKRYIAVGANDGMLHIFDDADGSEVFAFIPPDLLPKLKLLPETNFLEMVDGDVTLFRRDTKPKYLIFGERRGGPYYYCLDVTDSNPLNWTFNWQYTNSELAQTWSTPVVSKIPVSITTQGEVAFKDVLVFSGGYDEEEDHFPEPFNDEDGSGSPFAANGSVVPGEWNKNDDTQDVYDNGVYDVANPAMNEVGRGIFVVDIDDPTDTSTGVLPFSLTYGAADVTTGLAQKSTLMKYCIPATPSLVEGSWKNVFFNGSTLETHIETNLLFSMYTNDIYSNTYRLRYNFDVSVAKIDEADPSTWTWTAQKTWLAGKVFSGNPGSDNSSGTLGGSDDADDFARKSFYSPEVAWGGSGLYFDKGNYPVFNETTNFYGTDSIASLFFGTGDREHPSYSMVRNRFYSVYDESSVFGLTAATVPVNVSTAPHNERDLLNVTCGEFDTGITLTSGATVAELSESLTEDATYDLAGTLSLENVTNEDDAKGWYIILEDQGDPIACSHVTYPTSIEDAVITDDDNHDGEKILSKPVLYAGIVYFTSYQSSLVDPCNPLGNGYSYAINYDDGSAAYDMNQDGTYDVTDRYKKYTGIFGIPSGFAIITRYGQAGAMAMMGSRLIGPAPDDGGGGGGFKIKNAGLGLELYYWRRSNSLKDN